MTNISSSDNINYSKDRISINSRDSQPKPITPQSKNFKKVLDNAPKKTAKAPAKQPQQPTAQTRRPTQPVASDDNAISDDTLQDFDPTVDESLKASSSNSTDSSFSDITDVFADLMADGDVDTVED